MEQLDMVARQRRDAERFDLQRDVLYQIQALVQKLDRIEAKVNRIIKHLKINVFDGED